VTISVKFGLGLPALTASRRRVRMYLYQNSTAADADLHSVVKTGKRFKCERGNVERPVLPQRRRNTGQTKMPCEHSLKSGLKVSRRPC